MTTLRYGRATTMPVAAGDKTDDAPPGRANRATGAAGGTARPPMVGVTSARSQVARLEEVRRLTVATLLARGGRRRFLKIPRQLARGQRGLASGSPRGQGRMAVLGLHPGTGTACGLAGRLMATPWAQRCGPVQPH